MSKKVSYINLLKEAITEFDTSDTVDVKGPMLDPILSWQGDGEMPTNKDAASILERYYFNEDKDEGISPLDEADYENDKGEIGDSKAMKHTEGPGGEEQAGTAGASNIQGAKKEKEKDIAKEDINLTEEDEDEEKDEEKDEEIEEDLELENAIVDKLIAEMEHEEDEDEDEDEEKEDVGIKEEEEAKSSMQHTKGAGTEQAGTGDAEGEIPNRKDRADQMTKPADVPQDDKISDSIQLALDEIELSILEQDDDTKDEEEPEEEEEKDLDVDKEMKEQAPAPSAVPGGPSPKKTGEDADEDVYEEAFKLFKEEIEADVEEIDLEDIRV